MNATGLSDFQLVQLIENKKLDASICEAAELELNSRNLDDGQIAAIRQQQKEQLTPLITGTLSTSVKWILVLCPIFLEIHSIVAGRMLAGGQKQKWKQYWMYIGLGYLLWTVAFMLFARFSRR